MVKTTVSSGRYARRSLGSHGGFVRTAAASIVALLLCCSAVVPASAAPTDPVVFDGTVLQKCLNFKLGRGTNSTLPITEGQMAGLAGDFTCSGATNLTGLQFATGITGISLINGTFTDLSPIANLTNLTRLDFNGTITLTDISPLAKLTDLTSVGLNLTKVSNIAVVANFTSLASFVMNGYYLDASRNTPAGTVDPSPLTGLPLATLTLNNVGLTSLSFLQGNTTLTSLSVSNNRVTDLAPLSTLAKVTDLRFGGNAISDASQAGPLPLTNTYGVYQWVAGDKIYVPSGAATFTYTYPANKVPVQLDGGAITWVTQPGDDPHTNPSSGNTITFTSLAANDADTYLANGFTDTSAKSLLHANAPTSNPFSGQIYHGIIRAFITSSALADGRVGDAYSQQLAATTGFPVAAWTIISGSVPGVSVSSSGLLSGTPTTAGTYQVTVRVTDVYGNTIDKELTLAVAEALVAPTPTPSATTNAKTVKVDTGIPTPASGSPWMVLLGGVVIAVTIGAGGWLWTARPQGSKRAE